MSERKDLLAEVLTSIDEAKNLINRAFEPGCPSCKTSITKFGADYLHQIRSVRQADAAARDSQEPGWSTGFRLREIKPLKILKR